jgi:hypothetical protein
VFPKRMTSREEVQVDRMNDESSGYETFCYGDRMSRNKAIEQAAKHTGYDRFRGCQMMDIRGEGEL